MFAMTYSNQKFAAKILPIFINGVPAKELKSGISILISREKSNSENFSLELVNENLHTWLCLEKEKTCTSNEFLCKDSKMCIPLTSLCNYKADCSDKSDEGQFCGKFFDSLKQNFL